MHLFKAIHLLYYTDAAIRGTNPTISALLVELIT